MLVVLPGANGSPDRPILGISTGSAILTGICRLFHIVTLLAFTGAGVAGVLIFYGYLPWIAITGRVLIAVVSAVAVPATTYLTLTLCLFCVRRRKKQMLEDYTNLILRDPSATLPGNPDKKLLDCLNNEWEVVSWAALAQSKSVVGETAMADCFEKLQKCKFVHELEMFHRFLKEDLTGEQRQKVKDLEAEMRKKFDDEMKRLSASVYSTRMRYNCMVDFFIILENDTMEAAIKAGLTDFRLPSRDVKISHLSLSGGGARGCGYGKMLKMLKPLFAPDCKFSGTSVGAIAALAAALGLDDFEGLAREMQRRYSNSARDNQMWKAAYAWLRSQLACWPAYYDFTGVLALLDQRVQEKVSAFLDGVGEDTITATFPNDPVTWERMRTLKERYNPSISREGKMPTFLDFEHLQQLPGGREQFHDFAAAIWDKTDQKVVYAKKETQPNMPVVLAVYASMSIPFVFKFLSIPLENSDGKPHQLCDGGFGAHLPIDAYLVDPEETWGVVFDCNGWGGKTLWGNVRALPKVTRVGARLFGIARNIEDSTRHERERVLQSLEQIYVLLHGELEVLSFGFSRKVQRAIRHQVKLRSKAWIACGTRRTIWPGSIWSAVVPRNPSIPPPVSQ
jgi:predicted acylesterase/phospholipase RssA